MLQYGPRPSAAAANKPLPRLICYHQTHSFSGEPISILPLLERNVTHIIVAAIHINDAPGDITLNDYNYLDDYHTAVWEEARAAQLSGVKVLGMLGGAAKGSFQRLDGDWLSFVAYYEPLRQMIEWCQLDGLDLDVEENMSLSGIIRLIDQLKTDFGQDFLITLAPVATALRGKKHISGFDYAELEKAFGRNIAWYNTQFYNNWGSLESSEEYEEIISCGWDPRKVVMGLITNPEAGAGWVPDDMIADTIQRVSELYPAFGGVMGWEYFSSITVANPLGQPWCWADLMSGILTAVQERAKAELLDVEAAMPGEGGLVASQQGETNAEVHMDDP